MDHRIQTSCASGRRMNQKGRLLDTVDQLKLEISRVEIERQKNLRLEKESLKLMLSKVKKRSKLKIEKKSLIVEVNKEKNSLKLNNEMKIMKQKLPLHMSEK